MQVKSKLFVLAAVSAIALATSALADSNAADEKVEKVEKVEKKNVAVFINKDGEESDAEVKLKINGESWKFQLPNLSEGEERIIATEDGRTVKAKRTGKEVTVEAGGETIKLLVGGHGMHARFHGVPPVPPVPPVPAVHAIAPAELKELRNSIVISGVELTEAQQTQIRDAIKKAGVDKPVKFLQGGKQMMLHSKGPMVWHGKGDGSNAHSVVVISGDHDAVTEDVLDTDDGQIQHDIKIIRKKEVDSKDGDTQ